ncbi:hypothetical protein [Enterobacter hormaechei]|uniref:hypothetical protein n=1 Tax=Enterobacter hormaechei TaxID=158836 RepID=UPI002A75564A|nr:hypothetical protein [Enterobacter hormaechei]MDY3570242.1 hypothetical protein [Enterobacter hormaechei]
MDIKSLTLELECWAKGRWKNAAELITKHHQGELLEPLNDKLPAAEHGRRLHNNTQIIQRAFRGETAHYRRLAIALAPAVRAAIGEEEQQQQEEHRQVAIANRECIEATSAMLLRKPSGVIQQETLEAINALASLAGMKVQISHQGGRHGSHAA